MENSLNFALIQTDNIWEDIDKNLENLTIKLNSIANNVDVIVLPELFSTGFTMNAKAVAENMKGKAVLWMLEQAKIKDSLLMGSLLINEGETFYNRLVAAFPDGKIKYYDKRHLFSYAKEDHVFSPGNKKLIFEHKGFRFFPLICYDLRFPVWARNTENIDVLIYVANWPNARMFAWDTLLKARAIENLCYTIGVNRVGIDNNNLVYTGHSAVYNALGETLLDFEENKQDIKTIILKKDYIKNFRDKFRFLDDRDEFKII
ncbi:MAG: nitrilase family protein [Bacteroidota bacterium]